MKTIAAISTPVGVGGIGIVRISGEDSLKIIEKIFIPKVKEEFKSHTIKYGHIKDKNGNIIDEVLVSYFQKPRTYTGEDICEINCHGGNLIIKRILEEILKNGAEMAEAGEFTKRAFLNGRIDLSQAEAVIDVINSKSIKESKASLNQLQGYLSNKIKQIKRDIIDLLIDIEANIDYPEYDIEEVRRGKIEEILNGQIHELSKLEKTFDEGKILKNGINTAIIGKPNVGKSSLLNALLKEDRAIVTEVAGTTRDTIEEYITIKGIPLKIVDTAGIRDTKDMVEEIGIKRSRKALEDAELVLMILDSTVGIEDEDKELLDIVKEKKNIVIINKIDAGNKIKKEELDFKNIIEISAKTLEGFDILENKIEEMFKLNQVEVDNEIIITNVRHKDLINKSKAGLQKAVESLKKGIPVDMISIDIQESIRNLGEIIGESISEDVISGIFAKFCVGK